MKLSLITLFMLLRQKNPPKPQALYAAIKKAGFNAVDLCAYDFELGTETEIRHLLHALGLQTACYIDFVCVPALGDAKARQNAREQVCRNLERTELLGAKTYMFAPSGYAAFLRGVSRQTVADALAEDLAAAVDNAAAYGITVVLEDAPDLTFPMCSAEEVLYLLRKVPGLRHVFDTANMIAAGEDPIAFFKKTKSYLSHVHLKDMRFTDGTPTPGYGEGDLCANGRRMVGVLSGDGMVDFAALVPAIQATGFEGHLAVEYVPQQTDADIIAEMEHCRAFFEQLGLTA